MKSFNQYITEKTTKLSATFPYKGAEWKDFREGDSFTVLATSKTGSIVSPQGINTRLALSPRQTSRMYATRSVETDQANC